MFTRWYRSFSLVFSHSKQWCSMISPCFFPGFFPWVSPWFSDGFSHLKPAACKEDGTASGVSTGGLVPAGRATRRGASWDVGCWCRRGDKITQNIPKWWDKMGHLHTFTHRNRWFYLLKMVDLSMAMLNNQMGLSENVGLIFPMKYPFKNGIMISKTIGFRGTLFSDIPTYIYTMWCPPVINCFLNPMNTIVISTINHSYWSYKST